MQLKLPMSVLGCVRELLNASPQQGAPPADTSSSQHTAGKLLPKTQDTVDMPMQMRGFCTAKAKIVRICQRVNSMNTLAQYHRCC